MTANPNSLGVGVIGLGVGEQHALTYAGLGGCDLRWLFDISEDQAQAVQGPGTPGEWTRRRFISSG